MSKSIPELYGSLVFNDSEMKARLPKDIYKALAKTINSGSHLELDVANSVAVAMKEWALEHGATHFTHWFQPMTGITAEKHDSFLSPTGVGEAIMEFSGKELVKGEPDASSFPSGGLRATFEARGYTAWDPTSFAFIKGHTLCIPTAFCSYSGEALDKKTPLLRSMEAVSKEATHLLHILGKTDVKRVNTTVGAEQEYFLVDKECYRLRKDLIFCRRTLFGAPAPKGQEMDDHYFGSIKPRVEAFMEELNEELWKLGIPAKTEHNEVAPAQHELAPVFETVNVAVDHNQLVMEMMKKVADRHGLACLLHEKPFEGINGSGKHNNWALSTDTGENLLNPGKTPAENTQFLLFLAAVVEAVVDSIKSETYFEGKGAVQMSIGPKVLPHFTKDNTDRNRTSPFAFTGNKFEFRMPGSSLSLSGPNVILNTAVAESLAGFCKVLEGLTGSELDSAIHKLLKDTFTDHARIIFNGNGYTDEWLAEAKKRGLPNLKSTPEALPHLIAEKNIELFTKHHVLTKEELFSRYEILLEDYVKTIHIEAKTMEEMVQKDFLPSLFSYVNDLACTGSTKKELVPGITTKAEEKLITKLSGLADTISDELDTLKDMIGTAEGMDDYLKAGTYYHDTILAEMETIRLAVNDAEVLIPEDYLPYPTYDALLFYI